MKAGIKSGFLCYTQTIMSKILKVLFFGIIILNLILSSWFVLHKDIKFTSEIGRDFLLLDELNQKKLVLIGPSSTTGLFHGPLWMYLNYPAFILGNGNPVVVGYFWVFLIILFLISSYYIAKDLFDKKTAYVFTLMLSTYSVYISNSFYNPHGAFLFLPAFFYFFVKYLKTHKAKFFAFHIAAAGAIVQFQMAIGIPFFILSFLYLTYDCLKTKRYKHIFIFSGIILAISNFIVFDLRHQFLLTNITFKFLTSAGRDHPNFLGLLHQRLDLMMTGVEFFRVEPTRGNFIVFLILFAGIAYQIKNNKYKNIYLSFLYFYFGYALISLLNSGVILYFYFFPLFPLVFLIFSSLIASKFSKAFILLFAVIFALNIQTAFEDTVGQTGNIGKIQESWLFMKNAAVKMYSTKDNNFGYFVYSPDSVAYREKYAIKYASKNSSKKSYYFQKKPITYVFIAPPPRDNPYMSEDWWIKNELHIKASPSAQINFENGYKIDKFILTEEEIKIPIEPNIDPGLTFR